MRNVKIILEYDGTDFVGWQSQTNGRSVQSVLEAAIGSIIGEQVNVTGAGRTDAGVHARGQVVNFSTGSMMELSILHRAVNGKLPNDVVVRSVEEVPRSFSARYSAKERFYRYFISRRPVAIQRNYCWEVFYALDLKIMNEACRMVESAKDFQSFCKMETEVENYLCSVTNAEWKEESDAMIVFSIRANRFLHGMVRTLVGTMVDVGRGFITLAQFGEIIDAHDRRKAGMAAPSKGLFLEEVQY